jgi:CelD/BcsL family acetyltransferase involved in cellulose biosynthesis
MNSNETMPLSTENAVDRQPETYSTQPPLYTHQRLSTIEEIEAERPVWDKWVENRYYGNPFLSLDWHLVWLKHFANAPVQIHYIKISDQQGPVAFFPMILKRESFHGVSVRVLRYAGNMYSLVNCPILGVEDRDSVFAYFARHAVTTIPWHLLRGGNLPPEHAGPNELHRALQDAGYSSYLNEDRANRVYHNEEIVAEEYFNQLGGSLRRDIRRATNRLAEAGDYEFRIVKSDLKPKDIDDYWSVYGSSWKQKESYPSFHPEVMEVMARHGFLRLGIMYLDQKPIAALLWFLNNGRGYAVKTAYNEEYKWFNPGKLLLWMMIERLIEDDGMKFFDLMKGDQEYKKRWTNIRRTRSSILAFQKGPLGNSLHVLDQRLLPSIRRNKYLDACKIKLGNWLASRKANDQRTEES